MLRRFFGWDSPSAVAKIHSFFEAMESSTLAIAIALELADFRRASNVFWALLVIADISQRVYGSRDKTLSEAEKENLLRELKAARERQGTTEKHIREMEVGLSPRWSRVAPPN